MRRIDQLHLDFPFAGSRMLRDLLNAEGVEIGRRHVATLMKRMGIEATYRRPDTSKPAPGHKIYPYLLRNLPITRPDQVWAMDITYIPMARGFVYLAAVIDWFSRRVLAWRLSITMEAAFCVEALEEALASRYNLTPDQYRQRWGLPKSYPMVAPAYAAQRSALAKQIGLGRKRAAAAPSPALAAAPGAPEPPRRAAGRRKKTS